MPFEKVEFSFPDDEKEDKLEIEQSSAEDMVKPNKQTVEDADDFDIEVVDDTPPEDRGRKPSEPPPEVTDDELEEYSEKVRKRIQHFSKGYHDERREKEKAMREREELERLAQKLVDENNKLKGTVSKNQTVLLEQAKKQVATELEQAKRAYKDAYESGNADALLEAQDQLTTAKLRSERVENFKVPALQEEQNEVQTQVQDTTAPEPIKPDEKAVQWADANPWFGSDDEMTSFALGLHKKLVGNGVDPQSNEYYQSIDARMRQVFPDQFDEEPQQEVQRKSKQSSNVVAPATRSTAPKKVKLTQTQVQIAKRLGVSLEDYAKQVADLMRNG